jgi:hypothetical protein
MISGKEAAEYLNISIIALERYINEGKLNVYYQPSPYGEVALFDRDELAQLNNKRHISPIVPTIDREFELVAMPSTELMSGLLPPFAELSEMALFDTRELEYFTEGELMPMPSTERMNGFLPSVARSNHKSSTILPTGDNIQHPHYPRYITEKEPRITKNPLDNRSSTGFIDVFLVLCAQSVGNLISTITDRGSSKIPPAMLKGKLLLNLDEAQILSGLSRTILMNAIKNHELPFQLIGKTYRVKSKDLERFVDRL